jgi:hypothetical protein
MKKAILAGILGLTTLSAHAGSWNYSQTTDTMDTAFLQKNAVLTSSNKINFSFPYNGGSQGFLIINKISGTNDINLDGYHIGFLISKGQITCANPCQIRIKFDNEKPISVYANLSSDKNDKIRLNFLYQPNISKDEFLSKLISSKKFLIEPNFYQEERKVFEFSTAGFKNI